MTRLSVVDEIFLRTHRGFGTPIAMQGIWRTADRVRPDLLVDLHTRLGASALGRRVVRGAVPGARPRWQPTARAHPLDRRTETVPAAELAGWAWSVAPDLDPETGPGWHLATAPIAGGGTAIVLTASHVLADARGMLRTVAAALTGSVPAPPAPPDSDWADARRQWGTVLGGTVRALAANGRPLRTSPVPTRPAPAHPTPRSAVLDLPAADWAAAGSTHATSSNGLFVTAAARMLWASGSGLDPVAVALPVDQRPSGDGGVSNQLRMATAVLRRGDSAAAVHEVCQAAYARRPETASRPGTPGGFPAELLQVLPERLAYRLSAGAGELDLLCSDIGRLPAALATFGPYRAAAVATRAIHPGLTAARFPRTRLSAYLCRGPRAYALALVSLDPDRVESDAALAELARAELRALGVDATPW